MRKNENDFLRKAKQNKNDEFYTQLKDIKSELQYYGVHFKNKVVFCPCDDPITSNFYRYFATNFKRLGLKKLISSCYFYNDLDLFSDNLNVFKKGYYYEYSGKDNEKVFPTIEDVIYFDGDGDFRSNESIELLKKSDIEADYIREYKEFEDEWVHFFLGMRHHLFIKKKYENLWWEKYTDTEWYFMYVTWLMYLKNIVLKE